MRGFFRPEIDVVVSSELPRVYQCITFICWRKFTKIERRWLKN